MSKQEKGDKKKEQRTIATTNIDEFTSRFDEDFTRIACLSSSGIRNIGVWYINSGASSHMIGVRKYFSSYREEKINFDAGTSGGHNF